MLAVVLALAAACSWGASDFIGGLQTRRLSLVTVMAGVQAAPLAVVALAVVIIQPPLPGAQALLASVAAGVVGLAGLSALYRALALGPMSLVAPISATGAAVPAVVGVAAGDHPSAGQAAGLIVAIAGVVLAARPVESSTPVPGRRGVPLAILAALGIGCFLLGAHVGARGGVLWFLLLSRAAGAVPLLALLARAGRSAIPRPGQLPPLLAVAALDGSATTLLALANRHGVVSVVSVVSSLYPAVTVLLARAVLGERLAPTQALGVAGALGGVALISAG